MSYFVYILHCSDDTFYTGITTNLEKRLYEHNHLSTGAKYTRSRRPVQIVYSESCQDRSNALKREIEIKKFSRAEKYALIAGLTAL